MSALALTSAAAALLQMEVPPPEPPLEPPVEFSCLTSPPDELVVKVYEEYVETFSMDVVRGGKMEPSFKTLIQDEGARCAREFGWDITQKDMAIGYNVGQLMNAGLWNASSLGQEELERLRIALEGLSVTELELYVGFIQLRDSSPSAQAVLEKMVTNLLNEAELDLDEKQGEQIGGMIAALAMSSLTIREFDEVSAASKVQEGEE